MKICLIGPVQSNKYFGGVATFTESLADGFKLLGHEVKIITDYANEPATYKGVPIIKTTDRLLRRSVILPFKIKKAIIEFNPDLIISSLEYGWVLPLIKSKLKSVVCFHYLHAFPAITTGSILKKYLLNYSMKYISNYADQMIANSRLTAVINAELYGIRVDSILNIGVGYEILDRIRSVDKPKNKGTILYAGRLAKEKNIYNFLNALEILKNSFNQDFEAYIAGDGPEKQKIDSFCRRSKIKVRLVGQQNPQELSGYYRSAEIFISLNPHEPFGITFLEALVANCKIVCPFTGGQFDFTSSFKESFTFVNPYSSISIAKGLQLALDLTNDFDNTSIIEAEYTYKNLANKLINLFSEVKSVKPPGMYSPHDFPAFK